MRRPPEAADLRALDVKYTRDDFADAWDDELFDSAVMVVMDIERWICWADWD